MLRSIVEAWLPLLGWLAACGVSLGLLVRFVRLSVPALSVDGLAGNGLAGPGLAGPGQTRRVPATPTSEARGPATLDLAMRTPGGRWRELPRCESGSVQSLAFVLTFPIFLMVVLLIIQISQLMLGIAVVHYAAFSAARTAIVWLPAHTDLPDEQANHVLAASLERGGAVIPGGGGGQFPYWASSPQWGPARGPGGVDKMHRVWRTAALACAPLAPTRRVTRSEPLPTYLSEAASEAWLLLAPKLVQSAYYKQRLQRQVDYSIYNTLVVVRGRDADGASGPTYNPYPGHYIQQYDQSVGQTVAVWVPWDPFELGWEDPVTVSVYHNFALLPGPGRFLSEKLVAPRTPDLVSRHLREQQGANHPLGDERGLYVVTLEAHSTLQMEGLKSVMPYRHLP
ncbi:MAG: TadE/TadG family type IV pilus assembly protein [Planctomycetaceae bacterium]